MLYKQEIVCMQLHCHSCLLLLIKLIDFPIKRHILRFIVLSHPTHANWVQIVLWELLAADIEGIEGIGAVGAVFEKISF